MKEKLKQLFHLFITFMKIGVISFGGGYGMISVIEREVVEKKSWISAEEMLDIIAIAESTPGPIAVNTATFVGVKKCGVLGGIVATLGVIIPPIAIIILISYFYDKFIENKWVNYAFKGIRVAVIVLIFNAVIKFIKNMDKTAFSIAVSITAFALAVFTSIDVIIILLCSAVISLAYSWIVYAVKRGKNK